MSFELKGNYPKLLDISVGKILNAYKDGEVTEGQAVQAIGHVVTAAARDNKTEVHDWTSPERIERWKKDCIDANRT